MYVEYSISTVAYTYNESVTEIFNVGNIKIKLFKISENFK